MPEFSRDRLLRFFLEDRKALLRYARRLVGSHSDSEDVVQEAFLRTYERAESVSEPRAFAFTAARNFAADRRRHARVAKTDCLGDLADSHVVAGGKTVEDQVLADEESALLREAIEQLSPQCRAAFKLRVFHACSYKEIAQQLGISAKTVENHIARAVRETHEYLRQRCGLT